MGENDWKGLKWIEISGNGWNGLFYLDFRNTALD